MYREPKNWSVLLLGHLLVVKWGHEPPSLGFWLIFALLLSKSKRQVKFPFWLPLVVELAASNPDFVCSTDFSVIVAFTASYQTMYTVWNPDMAPLAIKQMCHQP